MQFQNKKRIAYLASLTLFFSYTEMLLPRFLPFFRLGLGNVAILSSFTLDFPSFLILCFIKSFASCMTNGTLISPFFIISISQSLISGLFMYGLFKIKGKFLSLYGISICGSIASVFVQISLSALYLGKETFSLLGPMMIFSIFAAILTAILANFLKIPENTPEIINTEENFTEKQDNRNQIFCAICILISTILIFMTKNIVLLSAALVIAFIFQKISGRKIYFKTHIFTWIFIIFVSIFTPSGKVWFKILNISVTEGAFFIALEKALKLSAAVSLSQVAATLKPKDGSFAAESLKYYGALIFNFRNQKGNIFQKIKKTLEEETLPADEKKSKGLSLRLCILILVIFALIFTAGKIFKIFQ